MVSYNLGPARNVRHCRQRFGRLRPLLTAAAFVLPALAPAFAQDGPTAAIPVPASVFAGGAERLFDTDPLPDADLAATTGREQANWLNATSSNNAIVSDNHVGDNSVTGGVNLGDSAFQNVSGVSMVNFNTGNNSSINAAMSVNLQINYASPAP